jgi:hypothetical protein
MVFGKKILRINEYAKSRIMYVTMNCASCVKRDMRGVEVRRLGWPEHQCSAKETSPCNKLTFTEMEGTRRVRENPPPPPPL